MAIPSSSQHTEPAAPKSSGSMISRLYGMMAPSLATLIAYWRQNSSKDSTTDDESNENLAKDEPERPTQQCIVCTEERMLESDFICTTDTCTHLPQTCFICIQYHIKSNLEYRRWNDIRCPECNETIQYQDVERLADPETFERFADT
jgi:hypothetical protein